MHQSREFLVVRDLYKESKAGPQLLRKNVQSRMRIYLDEIYMVEEVVADSGKTLKNKCGISIRDKGFVVVKEPFESVSKEVFGDVKPDGKKIGFYV